MKGKPLGRIRTRRKPRPPTQQQERFFREQYAEMRRTFLAKSLKRFRWWSKRLVTATLTVIAIWNIYHWLPMGAVGGMILEFVLLAWIYPFIMWLLSALFVVEHWYESRKAPPGLMEESRP